MSRKGQRFLLSFNPSRKPCRIKSVAISHCGAIAESLIMLKGILVAAVGLTGEFKGTSSRVEPADYAFSMSILNEKRGGIV